MGGPSCSVFFSSSSSSLRAQGPHKYESHVFVCVCVCASARARCTARGVLAAVNMFLLTNVRRRSLAAAAARPPVSSLGSARLGSARRNDHHFRNEERR
jgi:hypothetical protein